jgi:hypothetical protein
VNIPDLRAALREAGVSADRYALDGDAYTPHKRPGYLVLAPEISPRWGVTGGDDVVYGWPGLLCAFDSEAEACEAFYQEMTRSDAEPFAPEKAEWKAEADRRWRRAEQDLARTAPELAAERAHWASEWERRAAHGHPMMTARELAQALERAGKRQNWFISGIDPAPNNATNVCLIGPDQDGSWYVGEVNERSVFHRQVLGLSEGEACRYAYETATKPLRRPRLTQAQWRGQCAAAAQRYAPNEPPQPNWPSNQH